MLFRTELYCSSLDLLSVIAWLTKMRTVWQIILLMIKITVLIRSARLWNAEVALLLLLSRSDLVCTKCVSNFIEHLILCIANAINSVNLFCCIWSFPTLLYGMNAISPTKSELNSLEYTFRSSARKIFKIAHVASVLQFMNEKYITDCGLTSRLRFMQKCLRQDNDVTKLLMCCLSKFC